jgi:acyl carrier protein
MEKEKIFESVCQVIENSVGIASAEIRPDSTLFNELHIDSIDLVDILFELETMYDIELSMAVFEENAREELGDKPFEVEGIITRDGLDAIRKNMPEIEAGKVVEGLTIVELVRLFNVQTLTNLIARKIQMKA